jgi:hypothetical protein
MSNEQVELDLMHFSYSFEAELERGTRPYDLYFEVVKITRNRSRACDIAKLIEAWLRIRKATQ